MSFRKSVILSIICMILFPLSVTALGGGEQLTVNPRGVIEYLEGDVLINGGAAEIGQEIADVQQGNSRSVKSDYHAAYRFSRDGDGVRLSSAALLYHNDATMNLLAAKIRVRIPWGKPRSGGSSY